MLLQKRFYFQRFMYIAIKNTGYCFCQNNVSSKLEQNLSHLLLINSIMLRQKRFSFQRSPVDNSINGLRSFNLKKIAPTKQNDNNDQFMPHAKILKRFSNRFGLRELDSNQNHVQDLQHDACVSISERVLVIEKKSIPESKNQQEVHLIKNQEIRIPTSQLNISRQVQALKNRPYTSLSNKNRKSLDNSYISQRPVVLHFNNKQETLQIQDAGKISTSRALMTYSKIYRNSSSAQRFKVRKDRHLYRGFVHLQAQKVVLHQKQKKQRAYLEKLVQKHNFVQSSAKIKINRKSKKDRYADQQQFQIGGWEYFQ